MNRGAAFPGVNRTLTAILLAFLLGSIFGLIVLGWGVYPVEWTDATPAHMRPDYQNDYLRMAIQSFAMDPISSLARYRWQAMGETAFPMLMAVQDDPQTLRSADIAHFYTAAAGKTTKTDAESPGQVPSRLFPPQYCVDTPSTGNPISPILIVATVISSLISAYLLFILFLKPRESARKRNRQTPLRGGRLLTEEELGEPVGVFKSVYAVGNNGYDDSFQVCAAPNILMGECGIAVADSSTFGETKLPEALALWVYDRHERQMCQLYLATPRAYKDRAFKSRLEDRAHVLLLEPEAEIKLRTRHIQVKFKITSLMYGDATLPSGSISRVDLAITVWLIKAVT